MAGTLKAWRNTVLRFGAFTIPASLIPAKDSDSLTRHRYDRATSARVRQAWTADGENIAAETFLAFDVDGTPVEVEVPDDGSAKEITLRAFVSEGTLDPVFYEDAYVVFGGKVGADGLAAVAQVLRDNPFMMFAGSARFTDRTRDIVLRWSEGTGCLVLHTLTFASRIRFASFRIAAETLPTPDEVAVRQAETLTDALPDSFVPADADPLEALVLEALAEKCPPAKRDAIPAPHVSAADILDTLRADIERRADGTSPRRTKSKSSKSKSSKSKS